MPPLAALLLVFLFCYVLLRHTARSYSGSSSALLLPLLWIFFETSKFPSQWLALFHINLGGGSMEEGSPFDAFLFLFLIVCGIIVIGRRSFNFQFFFNNNKALCIFLIYCALAILWSDFPFIAIKRWIKTLGHPVMALILLTDPFPLLAIRTVLKQAGILMLPLSVVFIKYFPEYGRGFDPWSGAATNQGIHNTKNELGLTCFVLGIFFAWNLTVAPMLDDRKSRRDETILSLVFLGIVVWLLHVAQSATSLMCFTIGSALVVGLGFRWVSKKHFGALFIAVIALGALAETTIGIYAQMLQLLGKTPTLTDRTEVWADAMALVDSPIFGAGFESFWLGERLEKMWSKWWWQPIQAHNGYIETYLNLGGVGLLLLVIMLFATFTKISKRLTTDFTFARFRMGTLIAIIMYNFTEATFKGIAVAWTLFDLISIDYPTLFETRPTLSDDEHVSDNLSDTTPSL